MAETERLLTTAEIYFINGTSLEIDIYINGEASPSLSDPSSFAVGPTFVVTGDRATPFQAYTFIVRFKGQPQGEVLAEASVLLEVGRSFTGVFHWTPEGTWQLSIYENDLSRGTDGRLTVRNTSSLSQVNWSLVPNGENPEVPVDTRAGTLGHAEWQIARSVELNDYLFQAFIGDQLVTQDEDLDIGLEQNLIVHIVGAPYPTMDNSLWEQWLVVQELEFDPGIAPPDSISDPAPPFSSTDSNAPVQLDCPASTFMETRGGTVEITATDPDGFVMGIQVVQVQPDVDGFVVQDSDMAPSPALGAPGVATLTVDASVPEGTYAVTLEANHETLAQKARCTMQVAIEPITVPSLASMIAQFTGQPSISADFAQQLDQVLEDAGNALLDGDSAAACQAIEQFLEQINDAECPQMNQLAVTELVREAEALRQNLNCG